MTSSQPDNPTIAHVSPSGVSTGTQQANSQMPIRVGVLALQGSFREHMALLSQIPNVQVVEVRTKDELNSVAGLIIPGGESTTMALVAEQWGLIPELQSFAKAGRPVWGTCAGMIFLAERAEGEFQFACIALVEFEYLYLLLECI
jgi:5'-phosphate synthase pdxT subunit